MGLFLLLCPIKSSHWADMNNIQTLTTEQPNGIQPLIILLSNPFIVDNPYWYENDLNLYSALQTMCVKACICAALSQYLLCARCCVLWSLWNIVNRRRIPRFKWAGRAMHGWADYKNSSSDSHTKGNNRPTGRVKVTESHYCTQCLSQELWERQPKPWLALKLVPKKI